MCVTCHVHFCQNDRLSLMCHCGNTGVERTPNKSQHTKFTLENKSLLPLQPGFEHKTFRSRVRRSTNTLTRLPTVYSVTTKPRCATEPCLAPSLCIATVYSVIIKPWCATSWCGHACALPQCIQLSLSLSVRHYGTAMPGPQPEYNHCVFQSQIIEPWHVIPQVSHTCLQPVKHGVFIQYHGAT